MPVNTAKCIVNLSSLQASGTLSSAAEESGVDSLDEDDPADEVSCFSNLHCQ